MSWIQEWEERRQKVKELSKQKMAQVKENPVMQNTIQISLRLNNCLQGNKYIQRHLYLADRVIYYAVVGGGGGGGGGKK
jgi:hypothetical protein